MPQLKKEKYFYTMWYCIWSNQAIKPPSIYDCIFLLRIAKGKNYEIINLPFKPIVKWHLKKLHSISFLVSNCKTSVDVVLVFANHYKQTKRGYIYVLDICIIYRITQKLFSKRTKMSSNTHNSFWWAIDKVYLCHQEIYAINIAVSLYMYYITDGMCVVQYTASK